MYGKLALEVFLRQNKSCSNLLLHTRTVLLCIPLKIYPFVRYTSTALPQSLAAERVKVQEYSTYLKNYFRSQPQYKSFVVDSDSLNFETGGRPEFVYLLRELGSDPKSEEFIQKLKLTLLEEKERLDIEEICKSFYLTFQYRISNGQSALISDIVDILLEELRKRELSRFELLKVTFSLHETWRDRTKLFGGRIVKYLEKINKLSPEEVVVLFYFTFEFSSTQKKYLKFPLNKYLCENISSFNAVQLGIIAKGLRAGSIPCCREVRGSFMDATARLIESFDESPLYYVCKWLIRSITNLDGHHLLEFQEKIIPHISKYEVHLLATLIYIGENIHCLNVNLWEKVADIVKENINDIPLQHIQSFVNALTEFDVQDEELVKLAVERFENAADLDSNTKSLIYLLNALAHLRVYPEKLINAASYITSGPNRSSTCAHYETVSILEIDRPEFKFNPLPENKLLRIERDTKYRTSYDKLFVETRNKTLTKIYYILKELYGDGGRTVHREIQPLERGGFIMRFDQNLKPTALPISLKHISYYPPKALKDGHIWVYLYVLPQSVCLFGSNKPNLRVQTQLRHLKELGYNIITVENRELKERNWNQETVTEFLQNFINNNLLKISQQSTSS